MNSSFSNQTAFITGANRGMGWELTQQLTRRGFFVFMGVRDNGKGEQARMQLDHPERAITISLDLGNSVSINKAVQQVLETHHPLDILINNAGVMMDGNIMEDSTTVISGETLRKTFDNNFFGHVELTNQLLPLLQKSKRAAILNISSNMGSLQLHAAQEPLARTFAYNSSKAALNMYTILLANALSDRQIKVNAIHPGWVKTDMGGEFAPLEIEEAVQPMIDFLLSPDLPTGKFVSQNGEINW